MIQHTAKEMLRLLLYIYPDRNFRLCHLNWYKKRGILCPTGYGPEHGRLSKRYTAVDAILLIALMDIRMHGFSIIALADKIKEIQQSPPGRLPDIFYRPKDSGLRLEYKIEIAIRRYIDAAEACYKEDKRDT